MKAMGLKEDDGEEIFWKTMILRGEGIAVEKLMGKAMGEANGM